MKDGFWKRLLMAWDVLRAKESIVITMDGHGYRFDHHGKSLAFFHVYMKIIGNTHLWHREWIDLNSVDK